MKHKFPQGRSIYCIEKHTLEQANEFVRLANLVGLEIDEATLRTPNDKEYPYFVWDGYSITQFANPEEIALSLKVSFKDFFELLGSKEVNYVLTKEQQIKELFSTI